MNQIGKLHRRCPAGPDCPDDSVAHNLWHESEYSECEKELRALLVKCPACPLNNTQLVNCLGALERYEEADALVEDLLPHADEEGELPRLCAAKADILSECVGPRAAMPWFELAAELEPYEGHLSALASALASVGKRSAAADLAEKAISMMPLDPAVIRACVWILMREGRKETARRYLLVLAQRQYDIPEYYTAVAQALQRVGATGRALAVGKRVARDHPESLVAACVVSRLLVDAGKAKAAAPLLRRALKLDPVGHGKFALIKLALIAGESRDIEGMLRNAIRANAEFNDADTRGLLRNTIKIVTAEVRERDAAFSKLSAEHARVRVRQEALEASLAGYDLSEGGTNLEYALREGEGWHIEFMERMPDQARDLGIEIAAVSSQTGGGTIFLGVTDDGKVAGIREVGTLKDRDQWRHRIAQIATKVVQPPNPVTVYFNERQGLDVIKIWVPEGSATIYYVDHIAYIRNLDESRKATPEEIAEYFARRSTTGGSNGR